MTEPRQNSLTVKCEGPLALAMAPQAREVFLRAIDTHETVIADVSAATDLDLTLLQILLSAKQTAAAHGKSFLVKSEDGSVAHSKLKCAGIPQV